MTAPAGENNAAPTSNEGGGAENQQTPTEPKESPKSFSQADVDRIIGERFARENIAELKTKAAQFDEFTEQQKTEQQKLQDQLSAAEKRAVELEEKAAKAELSVLKQKVAAAKGLPPKLAAKLTGTTEAELLADADESFGDLVSSQQPFDHGTRNASAPKSMNDLIFGARKR